MTSYISGGRFKICKCGTLPLVESQHTGKVQNFYHINRIGLVHLWSRDGASIAGGGDIDWVWNMGNLQALESVLYLCEHWILSKGCRCGVFFRLLSLMYFLTELCFCERACRGMSEMCRATLCDGGLLKNCGGSSMIVHYMSSPVIVVFGIL